MKFASSTRKQFSNQKGVTLVFVAITLFVLIGFGALAIDLGHLYIVRNELQNGADAGALAGARVLYINDGKEVNIGANKEAYDVAIANLSEKMAVEVNWTSGNIGDVQRGHWIFSSRTCVANDSTAPVTLAGQSTEDLDKDINFIHAVRVQARRQANPATSFLARIFGFENFGLTADAVAYIGFAGQLNPLDADQPIAICEQSILVGNKYVCNVGRMLSDNGDTAGWSDLTQPSSCPKGGGGVSDSAVGDVICKGNKTSIIFGGLLNVGTGVQSNNFNAIRECWSSNLKGAGPKTYPNRTTSWTLTLPVIDCGDNNKPKCGEVVGAVDVEVVWITPSGGDSSYDQVPVKMAKEDGTYWNAPNTIDTEANRKANWNSFADEFHLILPNGEPAHWDKYYQAVDSKGDPKGNKTYGYSSKTIYFKPSCIMHQPTGVSGGKNFGILAEIPVLVK